MTCAGRISPFTTEASFTAATRVTAGCPPSPAPRLRGRGTRRRSRASSRRATGPLRAQDPRRTGGPLEPDGTLTVRCRHDGARGRHRPPGYVGGQERKLTLTWMATGDNGGRDRLGVRPALLHRPDHRGDLRPGDARPAPRSAAGRRVRDPHDRRSGFPTRPITSAAAGARRGGFALEALSNTVPSGCATRTAAPTPPPAPVSQRRG